MKHVYNWNQNKSYLDQPSKGDAFRQNGVHYVRWGDVLFNFAARPVLGWKTFVIVVITVLLTLNGKYDTKEKERGCFFFSEGLTFGN